MADDGALKELTVIKDYTTYFNTKYPQAGIKEIYRSQVWDDSFWDN